MMISLNKITIDIKKSSSPFEKGRQKGDFSLTLLYKGIKGVFITTLSLY
jgi:hypothetical protein